jgi:hypothetical protein
MGVNRYTSLTPSKFNPLSLEEIMLVPAMQRKKHDDTVKGLEEIRAKLANVDPEDKYFDEAVKLREQLNNKLTSQVEQINTEGFNPNSTGQFLAMNREYQDLMSPTGKLGMINQEKKNTQAYIENYRKEGLAMGLTPENMQKHIDDAIKKRNEELPLYDEKGRTIGLKVDKNVVKAQDIFKDFAEHAARSGMSSTARGNISAGIQVAPNGEFTYVNTTGWDSEKGDNAKQIQSTLNFMNSRLNDANSDYSKYYDYIGQDKESIAKALQEQSGIYKKDVDNYKSQQQITNLIDNRPKSGSGEDEENPSDLYSHSAESNSPGDDYEKVVEDANKVLNNPKATQAEKIASREKLDLIDEIKTELSEKDKHFKARSKYTKSIENNKMVFDLIQKAKNDKSLSANTKKNLINNLESLQKKYKNGEMDYSWILANYTVHSNSSSLSEQNHIRFNYGNIVREFNKKHKSTYDDYREKNAELINNNLSTRGIEQTVFTQDMKPAERQEYFQNVKDALSTDVVKTSNANYIDANGNSTRIDINDNTAKEIIQHLSTADDKNGNIISSNPARQGGTIGIKIKFKPNKDTAVSQDGWFGFSNKDFTGNEAIEMYIPITEYGDNLTGMKHTTNRVYNKLPKALKREVDKMVMSSGSGYTTKTERLGSLGVPANEYFGDRYETGTTVDFLKTGKGNTKLLTPYIIKPGGKPKAMTWNDGIDYNRLNDVEYFQKLGNQGLLNNIIFSYTKNNNSTKPLMLSNGEIDYVGMLNNLKYKNLLLPHTQDIIEFSGLK